MKKTRDWTILLLGLSLLSWVAPSVLRGDWTTDLTVAFGICLALIGLGTWVLLRRRPSALRETDRESRGRVGGQAGQGIAVMESSIKYYEEGWGNRSIAADGKTVRLSRPRREDVETAVAAEEWDAFWSLADSLGAWDWQGDYSRGIVGGTPWTLRLQRGKREMVCSGNGHGSDGYADPYPPGFERLYQAMMALASTGISP